MKLLATALILLTLCVGIHFTQCFIEIDKCLDRGGRWNYDTCNCEFAPNP